MQDVESLQISRKPPNPSNFAHENLRNNWYRNWCLLASFMGRTFDLLCRKQTHSTSRLRVRCYARLWWFLNYVIRYTRIGLGWLPYRELGWNGNECNIQNPTMEKITCYCPNCGRSFDPIVTVRNWDSKTNFSRFPAQTSLAKLTLGSAAHEKSAIAPGQRTHLLDNT